VTTLRAAGLLLLALGLQAALGRLWPSAIRFVDLLAIPALWYAIGGGPRAGLLAGCAAGLLQDAWFQAGVFGLNGFKKTLLGWAVGALGGWVDLHGQGGRLVATAVFVVGDALADLALRRLLDLDSTLPVPWEVLVKWVLTALLVAWTFRPAVRLGAITPEAERPR